MVRKESEVLRKSRDESDFGIEEYVKETEEISEEDGPILEAVAPRNIKKP